MNERDPSSLSSVCSDGKQPLNCQQSICGDQGLHVEKAIGGPRSIRSRHQFQACAQVLVGHLVAFSSWGFVNSFGIFQAYYTSALQFSPSSTSWIGSLQVFLTLFIGVFSGRAMDAGFFRIVTVLGFVFQLLGVFMTSLASEYWQLLLSQGLCQGLGNGLVFTPTISLVTMWFDKHRSLAVAGMTSGTATGGVILPLVARQLLPQIGFAWTVRVIGLILLFNAITAIILARPKKIERTPAPLIELSAFLDPWYSMFAVGLLLALFGLYFGYYYITPYAQDRIHVSAATSLDLLLVSNALGLPGRVVPGYLADRFLGPLNMLVITVLASGVLIFGWIGVNSLGSMWSFVVLYGFFGAGIQSMAPAALARNAKQDASKFGVRMGMVFALMSVGTLCGPPIEGALIQANGGSYVYAQVFGGCVMVAGALVLMIPRCLNTGLKLFGKT